MRINSLQVHPTPMWTSTLRGCLATPVSHCVKLKHNHPRQPSPSYEPGNPPPLVPSSATLFIFSSPFPFLRHCSSASSPFLFSSSAPSVTYTPILTDRSNPLQLSFILLPLSPFLLFFLRCFLSSLFSFSSRSFIRFSSSSSSSVYYLSFFSFYIYISSFFTILVSSLTLLSLGCLVFYFPRRAALSLLSLYRLSAILFLSFSSVSFSLFVRSYCARRSPSFLSLFLSLISPFYYPSLPLESYTFLRRLSIFSSLYSISRHCMFSRF